MESTADIDKVLVSLNDALSQVGVPSEHLSINTIHNIGEVPSVRTHQLTLAGEWRDESLQRGEEIVKAI